MEHNDFDTLLNHADFEFYLNLILDPLFRQQFSRLLCENKIKDIMGINDEYSVLTPYYYGAHQYY